MNTTFFKFSALALALGLSQAASASIPFITINTANYTNTSIFPVGVGLYSLQVNTTVNPGTTFNYNFSFTTPANTYVSNFNAFARNETVKLLNGTPVGDYQIDSFSSTLTPSYNLAFSGIRNGDFEYDSFIFNFTVSAVPEAEQWAMMLVGLTLVSLQTLKTKKASARIGLSA